MTDEHTMDHSTWFETYKPIVDDDGREIDFMSDKRLDNIDHRLVWTMIDGEEEPVIVSGFAYVNRLEIFICEVPFTGDYLEVI